MTNRINEVFGLIIITTCLCLSNAAHASEDPEQLLRKVAAEMTELLQDNKQRLASEPLFAEQIVREKLLPHIDTDGLGRRLLKRNQWRSLTPVQQVRFTNAFISHLIETYATGLANYDGHEFTFQETRFNRTETTAWVYSELTGPDREVFKIIYTLKQSERYTGWKVIDLAVNGVKILQNYREQLKTVDISDGFEELIEKIENTDPDGE